MKYGASSHLLVLHLCSKSSYQFFTQEKLCRERILAHLRKLYCWPFACWEKMHTELRLPTRSTGRPVHLSAFHTALYRLEEKGLVRSALGGATGLRGGRRKRLFAVTSPGRMALREARNLRDVFWSRLPAFTPEGGAA